MMHATMTVAEILDLPQREFATLIVTMRRVRRERAAVVPRTQEEKIAFRETWDAAVVAGKTQEEPS